MMTYENNNSFANQDFVTYENLGYFAQKFFEEDLEAVPVKGTRKPSNRAERRKAAAKAKIRAKALKVSLGYKDELVENPRVEAHHSPDYYKIDSRRVNRERQATRHFCSGAWRDEWDNEKAITRQTILSGQIIQFGMDSDAEFCRELEETLDFEWYFPEPEDPEDGLCRDYGEAGEATTSLSGLITDEIRDEIRVYQFAQSLANNLPENVKVYLREMI